MVSFFPYLTRSDAVGARRWHLFVHQWATDEMNVERDAYPYLPASEKVLEGMPRPVETMSATSWTLKYRQMTGDMGQPIMRASRILHRLAPLLHDGRPTILDMGCVWNHVLRLDNRKSGFIRGLFRHPPEKPAFRIWRMTTDVEGSLCRIQAGDDLETGLVDRTFRFLGIL